MLNTFHHIEWVPAIFVIDEVFDKNWRYGILQQLYSKGLRGGTPIIVNYFLDKRVV